MTLGAKRLWLLLTLTAIVLVISGCSDSGSDLNPAIEDGGIVGGSTTGDTSSGDGEPLATATLTTERGYRYRYELLAVAAVELESDPGFSMIAYTGTVRVTNLSGQEAPRSGYSMGFLYDVSGLDFIGGVGPFSRELLDSDPQSCRHGTEEIGGTTYCRADVVLEGTGAPLGDGEAVELSLSSAQDAFTVRDGDLQDALDFVSTPAYVQASISEGGRGIETGAAVRVKLR